MSGSHPSGDVPIVPELASGQGKRGSAGYDDHGESEIYTINVRPEKCRDLMTKDPLCCVSSDSTIEAASLMGRSNIGAVPVVEDTHSKKLIGIVTDERSGRLGAAHADSKIHHPGRPDVALYLESD